jgi:predicted Zn-dependent peptidase
VTFRRERYTADRIVVSAAGRLEHDRICDLASAFLGSLKPSTAKRPRLRPGASKGRSLNQKKPIQQAHLCIGTPAYSVKSRERYPLLVLNTLLGDGMSSRLFQSVREKHGLAYSVYSFANLMTDSGTFGVYAGLDAARVGKASDLIWLELEKLVRQPVGRSELRRTKDQLKGSMMLSMESIPNRMMRLGGAELSIGSLPTLDEIIASIERVTADDVTRVAADLFRRERFSTVLFEPTQGTEGSQT